MSFVKKKRRNFKKDYKDEYAKVWLVERELKDNKFVRKELKKR